MDATDDQVIALWHDRMLAWGSAFRGGVPGQLSRVAPLMDGYSYEDATRAERAMLALRKSGDACLYGSAHVYYGTRICEETTGDGALADWLRRNHPREMRDCQRQYRERARDILNRALLRLHKLDAASRSATMRTADSTRAPA